MVNKITIENSAEEFYAKALKFLLQTGTPFLVGGTYAFRSYTGITRETKDLDLFCKAGDYPRFLEALKTAGYKTEIVDARWLAKAWQDKHYIDLIFATRTHLQSVDDTWFIHAPEVSIFGEKVKLIPPEELIWSKSFVQHRNKYDGADVNHLILCKGKSLDWKRILSHMEAQWEVLFAHILNFRFVYPSERGIVPKWLMEELISRVKQQLTMPIPKDKVCRGPLLTSNEYEIDITQWRFKGIT